MFKVERKLIEFFEKNYLTIAFVLITILSLIIRISMLNYESSDYISFLSGWFDYLKANGGIFALKNYPGDYNAPYMTIMALLTYIPINKLYLIKGVSIFFDFALAISSGLLVKTLVKNKKEKKIASFFAYSVIIMLPTVMMNSAMWGQCDSIYTTFVILSLYYLIKEKYKFSFVLLGIAFAFKLQFIFILPLYVVLYVTKKKFSIFNFLLIPLTNFIMCLPAIVVGNPIIKCMSVYFNQTSAYNDRLVLNFPNIYTLINGNVDIFYKVGILFSLLVCILCSVYVVYKKIKWDNEKILTLALWFLIVLTFILPGMHERYLFCGEILACLYYIVYRKNLLLVIFLNINSIITYSIYLNGLSFDYSWLMSIVYLAIIANFTKYTMNILGYQKKENFNYE